MPLLDENDPIEFAVHLRKVSDNPVLYPLRRLAKPYPVFAEIARQWEKFDADDRLDVIIALGAHGPEKKRSRLLTQFAILTSPDFQAVRAEIKATWAAWAEMGLADKQTRALLDAVKADSPPEVSWVFE